MAPNEVQRAAAIDCGTNSIRLLIADIDDSGALTDVERMMTVVRLGEGVDTTGEFSSAALERTFAAVDDYAARIARHGAERVRFVATSASRDVSNREELLTGVTERLRAVAPDFAGPEVIDGNEEASLSFAGAAGVLDWEALLADRPDGKVLVVDLGGGSTEFVLGTAAGAEHSVSTNMGCVRFTERHLHSDPPEQAEIDAARAEVRRILDGLSLPLEETRAVVGVAGTVTTITAHALSLTEYDPARINGARLPVRAVIEAAEDLLHADRSTRAQLGFMHPGRVDVIGAGSLIWAAILEHLAETTDGAVASAVTSEHDILDGIALSVVGTQGTETAP